MSFKIEKSQGTYTVEKMQKTASIASTADGLKMEGNNFKLVNFQACPDMLLYACELINDLEQQLAKANERIAELELPRKRNLELIRALFYAPSSPVTAKKAKEIEDWFIKFEQLRKEQASE